MNITSSLKKFIRNNFPWPVYWRLKRIREEIRVLFSDRDLTSLAIIYKTDKWGNHFYTPIYQQWFAPQRYKPVRLLEIGIGGNKKPKQGGNSLRMWKRYFPKGIITGIDIYNKSSLEESRIHIYEGDQSDPGFLKQVSALEGPFDIIVDDGSHIQSHIITSFGTLFPLLAPGGIYVIEDTQTSYRPEYEGSTKEMDVIPSAMNYFINKIHAVNKSVWIKEDLQKSIPKNNINSIAFYLNLIIITKNE